MPRTGKHTYSAWDRAHRKDVQRRVEARRIMEKALGPAAIAGKDIDHKVSIKKGGNGKDINRRSNLRVRASGPNRADKTH